MASAGQENGHPAPAPTAHEQTQTWARVVFASWKLSGWGVECSFI